MEIGKHTIFGREGGGGGQPDPQKKIVSVGLFSTFRHPLAQNSRNLFIFSTDCLIDGNVMLFVTNWKARHCQKGTPDKITRIT